MRGVLWPASSGHHNVPGSERHLQTEEVSGERVTRERVHRVQMPAFTLPVKTLPLQLHGDHFRWIEMQLKGHGGQINARLNASRKVHLFAPCGYSFHCVFIHQAALHIEILHFPAMQNIKKGEMSGPTECF